MKKLVYSTTFLTIIALFLSFTSLSESECNSKALKREGISKLDPYYYSSSKVSTITYDYRAQRREIEVPLFKGEKYKMVFNKKSLPKDVLIEVYDKDNSHDNRTPLYSSKDQEGDILSFEPTKSKKMYVNYVVPEAKGVKEKGCLVFVLGYQLTFVKKKDKSSEE